MINDSKIDAFIEYIVNNLPSNLKGHCKVEQMDCKDISDYREDVVYFSIIDINTNHGAGFYLTRRAIDNEPRSGFYEDVLNDVVKGL